MPLNLFDHPICFEPPERLVVSPWHAHVPFAMFLVDILKPETIVELGTCDGQSYLAFCQAVRQLKLNTDCYAIDTWKGDTWSGRDDAGLLADLRAYHDPLYGGFSRLIQSSFDEALRQFRDESIRLLHIRSGNSYKAVKRTFDDFLPKMRRDGIVLFNNISEMNRTLGAGEFWDEIKSSHRHFEFTHAHGLGILALGEARSPELDEMLNLADARASVIRIFFTHLGERLAFKFKLECEDNAEADSTHHSSTQPEGLEFIGMGPDRGEERTAVRNQPIRLLPLRHPRHEENRQSHGPLTDEGIGRPERSLAARLSEVESDAAASSIPVVARTREVEMLTSQLQEKEYELAQIKRTLGWKFLSLYGRRLKYPYLLPVYRLYGRLKYPYLLPFYRFLGLAPKELNAEYLPATVGATTIVSTDALDRDASRSFAVGEIYAKPVQAHSKHVDIVVCVHNALIDAKRCLESVVRYTSAPYSLLLVDDGSDEQTRKWLVHFAASQGASLIRNEEAKGYTLAANQALRASSGSYVILLNSDTTVTPHWLDRMVGCAESHSRIGLVGPLSNTASWQSVPDVLDGSDWPQNNLADGWTPADMATAIAECSSRLYPRIPFLNGFCLMIKRQLIEDIGYFDEKGFGEGYGEENDYCLRAREAGWELAVADDAYVYHAQSRSYSHNRRKELSKRADQRLAQKHDLHLIHSGVERCRFDPVLEGIRARVRVLPSRHKLVEAGKLRWEAKRVAFILPAGGPGGGGSVVLAEAEAMRRMGVDVRIINLNSCRPGFERAYPDCALPVIYAEDENAIPDLLGDYDAAIATLFSSVYWMQGSADEPARAYYVQDFEPSFFREGSQEFRLAWYSYTLYRDLILVTKTDWNRRIVKEKVGADCTVVGASVDIDLYRPRRRQQKHWPQAPLKIAAMIRPSTPRRNAKLTLEVLREISARFRGAVDIITFGCQSEGPEFRKLSHGVDCHNVGILTRPQLACFLNEIDIFADLSSFQAMGLATLEAMACGAAVVAPEEGGTCSFLRHESNGLLVDTASPERCVAALERLIADHGLRLEVRRRALRDACDYYPERAAQAILEAVLASEQCGNLD